MCLSSPRHMHQTDLRFLPTYTDVMHPLWLCLMLMSILYIPQAFSLSFDFDFSQQPRGNVAAYLSLQGDTKLEDDGIELTKKGSENSVGRASYLEPVTIWDEVSGELANFTTTFSFQILPDPNRTSGDGMAFFLGNYPSVIPVSSQASAAASAYSAPKPPTRWGTAGPWRSSWTRL